jgi:hypothetical protein
MFSKFREANKSKETDGNQIDRAKNSQWHETPSNRGSTSNQSNPIYSSSSTAVKRQVAEHQLNSQFPDSKAKF